MDEDGDADGEGVVEELRRGWVRGVGRGGRAEGKDGGAGGWEEGDFVGGVEWGHFGDVVGVMWYGM